MQENASTKIKILKNVAYYASWMYNYEIKTPEGEIQGKRTAYFPSKNLN